MRLESLIPMVFLIITFVAGCGGGSDSTPLSEDTPAQTSVSAIAGFWDVSETLDNAQQDIIYVLVTAEGAFTEYDYEGDPAGNGSDCYRLSQGTITALGNNEYRLNDLTAGEVSEFTAIRQGSTLVVSFVDEEDDNGNGSTTDIITESYNELTTIDPASLQDCNQAPPMTAIPVINGNDLVVGGFDATRGGSNTIAVGAYKTSLETYIDNVTVRTTASLSADFLSQVDVFIVDAVRDSQTAIQPLNQVETAALVDFVNEGGGLIVGSDNPSFQSASNSFLTPFGLTAGSIAVGGPHTATVIDRTTFSDVTDGPFGQVTTVAASNTGSFTALGNFTVLSNWSTGPLLDQPAVVARSDIGAGLGRIVAVADHQTIIAGLEDSEILFLNAVYFVSKRFSPSTGVVADPANDESSVVSMYGITSPGSNTNPNTLVTVYVSDGSQSVAGTTGANTIGRNIDWDTTTNSVFATDSMDFPGTILQIDPVTGASTQVAQIQDSGGRALEIGALSFSSDGTLYAAEGGNINNGLQIGTVDLGNNSFTPLIAVPQGVYVPGMDIGTDGLLYAVYSRFSTDANTQNSLVTIDLSTRQMVNELPLPIDYAVGDVDFANDGFLYHSNFSYALIQINPKTGAQRNVGFGQVGALAGLASVGGS